MGSGHEPGCCFECQLCVDHANLLGICEGEAYAAANAINVWLKSFMAEVFRLRTGSGCRELRNVANARSTSGG